MGDFDTIKILTNWADPDKLLFTTHNLRCGVHRQQTGKQITKASSRIRQRLADDAGHKNRGAARDVDAAVLQIIGNAVDADEMIDLFAAAGLDEARLDILSDDFLQRVAALEQKNLALETLRKLLNDQIKATERTDIVQSKKFREALEEAMVRYTTKAITTAEMITRPLDLAKHLREVKNKGEAPGMTPEESPGFSLRTRERRPNTT